MKALILIDLQNDLMPWGSIGIDGADAIIPIANSLMNQFILVIASQDWHPANHKSFAANHPWRKPGQIIDLNGNPQLLWTMHCVENSFGAELTLILDTDKISKIIKKGTNPEIDSYSAFFENDHKKSTGLEDILKEELIDEVYIMGLAAEFGVKYTAQNAIRLGFKTTVIVDACAWVDASESSIEKTVKEMAKQGIQIKRSKELEF